MCLAGLVAAAAAVQAARKGQARGEGSKQRGKASVCGRAGEEEGSPQRGRFWGAGHVRGREMAAGPGAGCGPGRLRGWGCLACPPQVAGPQPAGSQRPGFSESRGVSARKCPCVLTVCSEANELAVKRFSKFS